MTVASKAVSSFAGFKSPPFCLTHASELAKNRQSKVRSGKFCRDGTGFNGMLSSQAKIRLRKGIYE
jgi:hypothetical protein